MNILHLESQLRGLTVLYAVDFPLRPHLTLMCSVFYFLFFLIYYLRKQILL